MQNNIKIDNSPREDAITRRFFEMGNSVFNELERGGIIGSAQQRLIVPERTGFDPSHVWISRKRIQKKKHLLAWIMKIRYVLYTLLFLPFSFV